MQLEGFQISTKLRSKIPQNYVKTTVILVKFQVWRELFEAERCRERFCQWVVTKSAENWCKGRFVSKLHDSENENFFH